VNGGLSGRVVRVESWEEFKHLIMEHKPESIAYNIEQGSLRDILQVSD